jgi:hypothetical protein
MGLRDKGEPSSERVGERRGERQRLIGEEQNPRQRRERERQKRGDGRRRTERHREREATVKRGERIGVLSQERDREGENIGSQRERAKH